MFQWLKGVQIFDNGVVFIVNLMDLHNPSLIFQLPYIVTWYHSKNKVRVFQVMNYFHQLLHGGSNMNYPIELIMICFSYFNCLHVSVTSCLTSKILYVLFILKYVTQFRITWTVASINYVRSLEIGMYVIMSNH